MISFFSIVGIVSCMECARANQVNSMDFAIAVLVTILQLALYSITALKNPGIVMPES